MKETAISYQPTDGLSYDPTDKIYWNRQALQKEVQRVFEVCHGCRMCFKYCDAFPNLFQLLDQKYDGQVRQISASETSQIMDACFQCKLCEVQCPYTPREQHEFQLDFPKLVHRYKAVRAKQQKLSLRDKILGNPDATGTLARTSLGLANVMNRVRLHRWFMQAVLGIHEQKLLPEFARHSFEHWAQKAGRLEQEPGGEVVLFQTCYVQNNEPELGRDTIEVLEANQVDVRCTAGLKCCGMPAWEHGDLERLRAQAIHNLAILMPFVEKGAKVIAINPTCSMMMRREWPELLPKSTREQAKALANAVMDPSEFLWSIRKQERFNTTFKSSPEMPIAYHAPCHLRTQAVGFHGRSLLKKIPGVGEIETVMECCGHDGTFAMTVEGFEPSKRIGKKAFTAMQATDTQVWATDCPLAALQFQQHAGIRPLHPMSILARAYRERGFSKELTPIKKEESQ